MWPQVSLLSSATPSYLTVDFQDMGKFSNLSGNNVELQRRLKIIVVLLDAYLSIYLYLPVFTPCR